MTPQELYRRERTRVERKKTALFAEIRREFPELRTHKRVEKPRTDADRERRRLVQQEYRRRLRPLDVRA